MNRRLKTNLAALFLMMMSCAAYAAGAGEEVIIVYNSRSPDSKAVAEYYAQRRQVPASQIFGFELSTNEEMTRVEFREELQRPLAKALEKQKLWHIASRIIPMTNPGPARVDWVVTESRIRYAVLCYGVPLKIQADSTLNEEGAEKLRPELRRNEAAVDSELALLPLHEQKLLLAGPLRNPVYALTNAAWLHPTNGVLLVARLDGPSVEVARGLVDKALKGEADGLWGRAYIDLRNTTEPGYKLGDEWIRNAGEICRRLGFETVVEDTPATFPAGFPMSQIALYIGWYNQDASGPFALPEVEFMPGAFAYHLHSFSATTLRSLTRGWVGPLVGKGATASMGSVYEPYLMGTPDMAVFTARFLYYGFSFGEAAYASQQVLSWQTTVVGDPLYRPFMKSPEALQDEFQQNHSKLLDWVYLRLVNINLASGKPLGDCVKVLEDLDFTRQSAVLTEKLGDLYAAQGKPSSATHEWQEALKLGPSPQQRVRLRLQLGAGLESLARAPDAYQDYESLLQESPAYPDKPAIYQKLLALARKLNKNSDAAKYTGLLNLGAK